MFCLHRFFFFKFQVLLTTLRTLVTKKKKKTIKIDESNISFVFFFFFCGPLGSQIAAVPALAGCNAAFGTCEAACVAALLAPTF